MSQKNDIATVLNSLNEVKAMLNELKVQIESNQQELLIQHNKTDTRLNVTQQLLTNAGNIKTTAKPKTAATTDAAKPDAPAKASADPPKFDANSSAWFRRICKDDKTKFNAYRDRIITHNKNFVSEMDNDKSVKDKKTEPQKDIARVAFMWNYIKKNMKPLFDEIESDFRAAKTAHGLENRPPQKETEPHSDTD
jgi:hypothetical protein